MRYLLFTLLLITATASYAQPQGEHCGFDRLLKEAIQQDPANAINIRHTYEHVQNYLRNTASRDNSADTVITIPVVVHVIHSGQAPNTGANISDTQILSQIDVLNACFNNKKTQGDTAFVHAVFRNRIADVRIKFCLARVDTGNMATDGITRDSFPLMANNQFDNIVKPATQWDPARYLNIWTVQLSGGILGYANLPNAGPLSQDGITVDYRYFGSKPYNAFVSDYDLGKTAVHEVGHWLGMYHIFNDGCAGMEDSTCATQGDRICDTPPQSGPYGPSQPSANSNTCSEVPDEVDMWENYMNYTGDDWLLMFSHDQAAVMRAVLHTSRLGIQYSNGAGNCKDTMPVGVDVAEVNSLARLVAYPNPSTGNVVLQYYCPDETPVTLYLADISGRLVWEKTALLSAAGIYQLDLYNQVAGMYFLRLKTAHSEKTFKISLVK